MHDTVLAILLVQFCCYVLVLTAGVDFYRYCQRENWL